MLFIVEDWNSRAKTTANQGGRAVRRWFRAGPGWQRDWENSVAAGPAENDEYAHVSRGPCSTCVRARSGSRRWSGGDGVVVEWRVPPFFFAFHFQISPCACGTVAGGGGGARRRGETAARARVSPAVATSTRPPCKLVLGLKSVWKVFYSRLFGYCYLISSCYSDRSTDLGRRQISACFWEKPRDCAFLLLIILRHDQIFNGKK